MAANNHTIAFISELKCDREVFWGSKHIFSRSRNTILIFSEIERVGNEEFVKRVYLSSAEGTNRRGRPLGRWKDRVKEYVSKRGGRKNGLDWTRMECMAKEKWRAVCRATSLVDASRESEASELLID